MSSLRTAAVAAAFVATFALLAPSTAAAGTISGPILAINIYGSTTTPYAVINVSGNPSNAAGCSIWPGAMVLDISTTRGKAALSLLTAAFLAGKTVTLRGTLTSSSTSGCINASGSGGNLEPVVYSGIN
jgi:hypothetical protein